MNSFTDIHDIWVAQIEFFSLYKNIKIMKVSWEGIRDGKNAGGVMAKIGWRKI